MAQFGKSASSKRSKPSYAYAIIGVALVLFLFGVVGWIFLNIKKTGDYFKENIQLHAYIYHAAGCCPVLAICPLFSISFIDSMGGLSQWSTCYGCLCG